MTTGRSRRFLAGVAASISTLTVAAAWAPPAFADRRGNSAVDAALAAEKARQAGATGAPSTPPPTPVATPRPAPATPSAPTNPAMPVTPAAPATITGTLDVGSSGDQVKMVEQRLDAL